MTSLSRLTLGTVQFGLPYGIANRSGQPTYETARDIIACAFEGGVNCLDTAAAYGESEAVIGRALAELGLTDQMQVVTKVPPIPAHLTEVEVDRFVNASVCKSLAALRLEKLFLCLFHREEDAGHIGALEKLQAQGLIERVGVSTYLPTVTAKILSDRRSQAIQTPTNILDQRFIRTGVFDQARQQQVTVFVRSVYLQGVLLIPPDQLDPFFEPVVALHPKLEQWAHAAGISLAELAVRFVLSLNGVTSLVLGVETVEQVQENIRLCGRPPLPPDLLHEILTGIPDLPDRLLMPPFWPKK
jgi:aryl-alcohol dehydrogenase-like predicted oxidoreductase